MNRAALQAMLNTAERNGLFLFATNDFRKFFPEESPKSLEKSLARMVTSQALSQPCKGLYLNPQYAARSPGNILEYVARKLRSASLCYVSLESMLSEYGVISQVPMGRLTVMTTGAPGEFHTLYGIIEFTHTKRSVPDILKRTFYTPERPLRRAYKKAAAQDLRRVGRNVEMMDLDELDDDPSV